MAQLRNQKVFSENAFGQAEWGQFYFATAMVRGLSRLNCGIETYIRIGRRSYLWCRSCGHASQYVYY
jgi:hypothetical protein